MIYCTKFSPSTYCEGEFGLWKSYEPALFNLISRTTMACFAYEGLTKFPKLHRIDNIEQYRAALTPETMIWLKALPSYPKHKLAIVDPNLDVIIHLRILQWKKHYRGRLHDNVVQFRSALTTEEDKFLTETLNAL